MRDLGRFLLFGVALAFILGITFIKADTPFWAVVLLGGVITAVSWYIYRDKPAPKAAALPSVDDLPQPDTCPWAVLLYKSGFVSLEELTAFCEKKHGPQLCQDVRRETWNKLQP